MPFQDQTGATALPVLTPEGAVPVTEIGTEGGDEEPTLLALIYRELGEQRRLFCHVHDLVFVEELE